MSWLAVGIEYLEREVTPEVEESEWMEPLLVEVKETCLLPDLTICIAMEEIVMRLGQSSLAVG